MKKKNTKREESILHLYLIHVQVRHLGIILYLCILRLSMGLWLKMVHIPHSVLVEFSRVHAQPVDVFAPPFEQPRLLLRELRAINVDYIDRYNVISPMVQQPFLKHDALNCYEIVPSH